MWRRLRREWRLAMRALGKLMQLVGLVMLPLSMVMEMTGALPRRLPIAAMLIMMVFGFAIFYAGRLVEGYAQR